jgi:hypothetical protein
MVCKKQTSATRGISIGIKRIHLVSPMGLTFYWMVPRTTKISLHLSDVGDKRSSWDLYISSYRMSLRCLVSI